MNFLETMFKQMFTLQNHVNCLLDDQAWYTKGREWYRAAHVECTELLDHTDWKWWAPREENTGAIQFELADLLHFAISDFIETNADKFFAAEQGHEDPHNRLYALAASEFEQGFNLEEKEALSFFYGYESEGEVAPVDLLEGFMIKCLDYKDISMKGVGILCNAYAEDFDVLHKQFIGKNILNNFRYAHGYTTKGKYVKKWAANIRTGIEEVTWPGEEDSDFLQHILSEQDLCLYTPVGCRGLWNELARYYSMVVEKVDGAVVITEPDDILPESLILVNPEHTTQLFKPEDPTMFKDQFELKPPELVGEDYAELEARTLAGMQSGVLPKEGELDTTSISGKVDTSSGSSFQIRMHLSEGRMDVRREKDITPKDTEVNPLSAGYGGAHNNTDTTLWSGGDGGVRGGLNVTDTRTGRWTGSGDSKGGMHEDNSVTTSSTSSSFDTNSFGE